MNGSDQSMMKKKPELLAPAANLKVLRTAIRYGADAVYIGGEAFSLRARADNFSIEDMKRGVDFAHEHDAKVYVTANIYAHNGDIPEVERYFTELKEVRPDALLISDPGVFSVAKRVCPEIDIHISTQANNTNYETYRFWHDLGATRVVTARELSLKETKELREKIPADMEIESFVHGAMCIAYSGRCLLSNYFTGRDANRGACTHPCRWKYAVAEENRPGEYLPIEETDRGTFIFNSKDLNMIEDIPALCDAGVDSFKIEGRMKSELYVATIARTYRRAIDDYFTSPEFYEENIPWYHKEIRGCTYRQFTKGFYYGKPKDEAQIYDSNTYQSDSVYYGTVEGLRRDGAALLTQKNKFSVGDVIEIMKPDGANIRVEVLSMQTEEGEEIASCPHSKMRFYVKLSEAAETGDLLRSEMR